MNKKEKVIKFIIGPDQINLENDKFNKLYNEIITELTSRHDKDQHIELYLSSCPGGNIAQTFSIIDCINRADCPVYTYCLGFNASAASLLFLAGHKRFVYNHSMLLFHESSIQNINNITYSNNIIDATIDILKNNDKLLKKYLRDKFMPEKYINNIFKKHKELILKPNKLLKYNMITAIL